MLVRCVCLTLLFAAACDPRTGHSFDGRYGVSSYTMNDTSCTPGSEIARPFSTFEIRGRSWAGVDIYPVYPCHENGTCDEDNDTDWSLVVREQDLDHVAIAYAASEGNSCVLSSVDLVIAPGAGKEVVLQNRTLKLALTPYDPNTCTTDNATAMRGRMVCASLLQLVGAPM